MAKETTRTVILLLGQLAHVHLESNPLQLGRHYQLDCRLLLPIRHWWTRSWSWNSSLRFVSSSCQLKFHLILKDLSLLSHLGLIWAVTLLSAAVAITLPKPSGIRTLVMTVILRLICSAGPLPTLIRHPLSRLVTRNGRSIVLTAFLALILLVYMFSIIGYLLFSFIFIFKRLIRPFIDSWVRIVINNGSLFVVWFKSWNSATRRRRLEFWKWNLATMNPPRVWFTWRHGSFMLEILRDYLNAAIYIANVSW